MTGRMVIRESYLGMLREWRGRCAVAKLILGIRRCGKSTLLNQFKAELLESGVPGSDILSIDFEDPSNRHLRDIGALNTYLMEAIPQNRPTYLFLDEVQVVEGWERTVAGLCNMGTVDVYVACSMGDLPTNMFTTRLTGRYARITMLPLSFHEFAALYGELADTDGLLDLYLRDGSILPTYPFLNPAVRTDLLKGLCASIVVEDVSSRDPTPNVNTAMGAVRFLSSNTGIETSIPDVAKGIGSSCPTAEKYVDALLGTGLFMYAEKYDIVGSKSLRTNGRYYSTDLGIRWVSLGSGIAEDRGHPVENLVFLELIRRGYSVCIGSYRGREAGFLATRGDTTEYFWVCQTILSDETRDREFRSFNDMKDSFPKTIITTDRIGLGNYGGIHVVNLTDWLLDDGVEPKVVDAPASWRIGQITIADD